MYRRRTGSSCSLTLVIITGIIAGVVFLMQDNWTPAQPPTITPLPTQPLATTPPPEVASVPENRREITAGALLYAPTAGIRTTIVTSYLNGESWDVNDLGNHAGYLQGTAWVNEAGGNTVLAGHAEVFSGSSGIFSNIEALSPGDPLIIAQDGQEYIFEVREIRRVEPDDLTPFYPGAVQRLTLTTCSDYDFLRNIYRERIVVIAERMVSTSQEPV